MLVVGLSAGCATAPMKIRYEDYVWPPPPNPPRIQLEDVVLGRADTVAKSRFQRALLGASPPGPYDWFGRPFAVAYDAQGRLLVTDSGLGALFRIDRAAHKADVFGTTGAVALRTPLGLDVAPDGRIYVADVGIRQVVAFDPDGKVRAVYGREGELENPTDAAVSPDGRSLYVADSKAHRLVVFDIATARQTRTLGRRGQGDGEFNFPSAIEFDSAGNLLVVDQINARVQRLTPEGRFLGQLGALGVGYAHFVRPKDVAVDEAGFVYVTDAAFSNVQIFDADLQLLTFVGAGGQGPGQFQIASGVAVRGDRFAIVDQLGRRVQVFRYLVPKTAPALRPAAAPSVAAARPAEVAPPAPPAEEAPRESAPARSPAPSSPPAQPAPASAGPKAAHAAPPLATPAPPGPLAAEAPRESAPARSPAPSPPPAQPAASPAGPKAAHAAPPLASPTPSGPPAAEAPPESAPGRSPAPSPPPAQPTPAPPRPKAATPTAPAASLPNSPTLTSVSPSVVSAPGTVELEVRGTGLRPDLQARVSRRAVGVAGVRLVRQRFVDPTLFRLTIRLERRVSPGACEIGFDDPRGGSIAPLKLEVSH